ncbi:uncharacterized protein IL334_003676 [Kwoniella shivajii]|uniref:Programmed cell death protein 2 C-terminal domain-containing protein n=1 Tax=Kwoniella shivajii TaxID=564305 RepID=A0ABZ1CY89_9TREE|nr:hypothetical protein IL334_003676 [Kwoniella shivajii]
MSPSSPAGSSSSSLSIEYTNVLLALPDGPIPSQHPDLNSHCISLIGGYPTFPPLPGSSASGIDFPPKSVNCGICHKPIPLLAQIYCPPEGGENDRTIYVWGCARLKCQKRDGSIRAFRASIRNEEYVRDVEAKRKEIEAEAAAEREKARKNPFTLSSDSQPNGSALFGTAQPLFGAPPSASSPNPFAAPPTSSIDAVPDLSSLTISTPSSSSTTLSAPLPAYQPAQYISTIEEYLPPAEDLEMDSDDEDESEEMKAELQDDTWEKMLPRHVDEVFQGFVRRLESADGGTKQVLRYELGGMPLPYSSFSPLCRKLFPGCDKPLGKEEELDLRSLYNPSWIPPCKKCGSKRAFELQLVPSLISLLKPSTITTTGESDNNSSKETKQSEEERKRELMELAKKVKEGSTVDEDEVNEMEWGTVMVFGCQNDCVGWNEEFVGVEWETTIHL